MAITLIEVKQHADAWFNTVMSGGSAAEQAKFFLNPNPYVYIINSGGSIDMAAHEKLHHQWIDEQHKFGDFTLTQLHHEPERARATGTVYWQATYKDNPDKIIKAVVGEDWILERQSSGELKFVLYMNTFHHLLPGSASVDL